MLGKNKKCIVLIQIPVEFYGEVTDKLGGFFYFLRKIEDIFYTKI